MASLDPGLKINDFANPHAVTTRILKLPPRSGTERDIAIIFEGVTAEEARTLIDMSIKIEQARTGDVLSPTEYGNRFSGLDLG